MDIAEQDTQVESLATVDSDSPTFGDIIGLSPIKPSNFQLISQEYESDVPSPQMVFKTPNFHCPKYSNLSERSQETVLNSSGYYSPGYANSTRIFSKITDKTDGKLVSYSSKEHIANNYSPNQSCTSPSDCVDTFISDPLENGDSSFISPEFNAKRDSMNTDNKQKIIEDDNVHEHTYSSTIYVKKGTNDDIESSNSVFLHCPPSKQDAYQAHTSLNELSSNKECTNLRFGAPNNKCGEDFKITSVTGDIMKTDKEPNNEQLKTSSITQNVNDSLLKHATGSSVHKAKDCKTSDCKKEDTVSLELQLHQSYPRNIESGDGIMINTAPPPSSEIPFHSEEGAQSQRGKRKRLQFEAEENLVKDRINSSDYTTETLNKNSLIAMLHSKQNFQSTTMDAKPGFSADVDQSEPYKDCAVRAPRPVGIGLHLNSLGKPITERNTNIQEGKILVEDDCLISSSEMQHGDQRLKLQNSSISYLSPLSAGSVKFSLPNFIDRSLVPCKMKNTPSEVAAKSEKPTQISAQKKRKKATEGEGQKRCNCKKSKCLKLYCDCFAAGSYCSEACQCQGCSNKEEYVGIVHETKQQIESRNPLAFAPKVIVRISEPMKSGGDNNSITPTSARHKQGCNCKKSLCLKKYCECFQSGVGCSLGCRCEGCKNTFGTKDGYEVSERVVEHKRLKERGFERDLSIELESIDVKQQPTNTKRNHSRLSPVTPAAHSIIENDAPIPQISLCYSSETVTPAVQIHEHSDAKSKPSSSVTYNHENGFHSGKEIVEYSPMWDTISLSPFVKSSPNIEGSSSISKSRESKSLQIRLLQEHGRIAYDHVSWHSSPMTPMHRFGERRLMQDPCSDMTLNSNHEDETPEILMESHEPLKSIKATSSPNQKRVSPPHLNANNTHTKSPSSSRGVRKFVLQSVPPFPKLTPYSKSSREDGT